MVTVAGLALACPICQAQPDLPPAGTAPMAQAIATLCDAQVAFLGEAAHGSGETLAFKAALAQALIQECGFRHVAFESPVYDFEDLREKHRLGTATMDDLYNAVGGLWSTAEEFTALADTLHRLSAQHAIQLSGLDPQLGSATSSYMPMQLAKDLSGLLPEPARTSCRDIITTLTAWRFSPARPDDASYRASLQQCSRQIREEADLPGRPDGERWRLLARNFDTQRMPLTEAWAAQRSAHFHANLLSAMARLPAGTKTLVWTANVHAAKAPLPGLWPLAARTVAGSAVPGQVRSVAFVASQGRYGLARGRTLSIPAAGEDSFEQGGLADTAQGAHFVAGQALAALDQRPSWLLGYGQAGRHDWSRLFDGVVVIPVERPPQHVRPMAPLPVASLH